MLTELLTATDVPERETFDRATANALDRLTSRMAAIQRYRIARKYVHGFVVDAACGCGYGTWLLAKCPAVSRIMGFDVSTDAIAHARTQYADVGLDTFHAADLCSQTFTGILSRLRPDTVVSLETIEHLDDVERFIDAVILSGATRFVVSFPSFETVRFNPYHKRDFTADEVESLVGHEPRKVIDIDDAVSLMVFDL